MSSINVSTEGMRSAAAAFEQKMSDWKVMVENIWSLLTDLDAMWDGDANEAFNALVADDKPKFERLYTMMDEYKNAINQAAEKYESTEEAVKTVVQTRAI